MPTQTLAFKSEVMMGQGQFAFEAGIILFNLLATILFKFVDTYYLN